MVDATSFPNIGDKISGFASSLSFHLPGKNFWIFFVIICVVVFGFAIYFLFFAGKNKKGFGAKKYLVFHRTIGNRMVPRETIEVEEKYLPNSQVRFFLDKKSNAWYPRYSNESDFNTFYIALTKKGGFPVNFTILPIEDSLEQAKIDYDYQGMLSQSEHLREVVTSDYGDQLKPWWEQNQMLISSIAVLVVSGAIFGVLAYFAVKGINTWNAAQLAQNDFNLKQAEMMKELANTILQIKTGAALG